MGLQRLKNLELRSLKNWCIFEPSGAKAKATFLGPQRASCVRPTIRTSSTEYAGTLVQQSPCVSGVRLLGVLGKGPLMWSSEATQVSYSVGPSSITLRYR